ncbi:hypothetical protein BDW68DRAFT_192429 [Aspergillus falconensis]
MVSKTKTILILGGSYAGTSTAHYALKHILPAFPSPDSYQVVLVSSSHEVICRPAAPRTLIADSYFDQSKLFVSVEERFKPYGEKFKFIHGRAKWLEHERRVVVVDQLDTDTKIELEYHALIIGTGSSTSSPLLSLNSAGKPELTARWKSFRGALSSARSILIAGGGPTGIETAGELGEHLNGKAGWFSSSLAEPKVKITVLGVGVIKNVKVEGVTPVEAGKEEQLTAKTAVKLSNAEILQAELRQTDGCRRTRRTLCVEKAGPLVYAAGDVSDYARPAIHILMVAIPVLCANLKRDLFAEAGQTISGEDWLFKADESETQLVPSGKGKGVDAAKSYRMPSFFVWLIKGRDYWLGMTGGIWSGTQWAKQA